MKLGRQGSNLEHQAINRHWFQGASAISLCFIALAVDKLQFLLLQTVTPETVNKGQSCLRFDR